MRNPDSQYPDEDFDRQSFLPEQLDSFCRILYDVPFTHKVIELFKFQSFQKDGKEIIKIVQNFPHIADIGLEDDNLEFSDLQDAVSVARTWIEEHHDLIRKNLEKLAREAKPNVEDKI